MPESNVHRIGGIEFDLNPIDIYEYSDMIEHMSNFMTGLNVAYNYNPYQQIQFQVLNSLNGPSEEMYGDLERTKLPLVYTLNWNGNFSGCFQNPLVCLCHERNERREDVLLCFG